MPKPKKHPISFSALRAVRSIDVYLPCGRLPWRPLPAAGPLFPLPFRPDPVLGFLRHRSWSRCWVSACTGSATPPPPRPLPADGPSWRRPLPKAGPLSPSPLPLGPGAGFLPAPVLVPVLGLRLHWAKGSYIYEYGCNYLLVISRYTFSRCTCSECIHMYGNNNHDCC